jgi:hypothetical protein
MPHGKAVGNGTGSAAPTPGPDGYLDAAGRSPKQGMGFADIAQCTGMRQQWREVQRTEERRRHALTREAARQMLRTRRDPLVDVEQSPQQLESSRSRGGGDLSRLRRGAGAPDALARRPA